MRPTLPRSLRSITALLLCGALVAACSGSDGEGQQWSFGPTMGPAGSGDGGEATAAPSGEGSAAPSGDASPAPSGSAAPAGGPTMTVDGLGVATLVSGLTEPTGIAFLAEDDALVIEKSTGQVKRVQGGQAGDPVLDLAVNFFDERGLLGIALHPSFATSPFVYLYWTASGEGEEDDGRQGADTDEPTAVPALGNRVDRFRWDGERLTFDREIVALRSNTLDTDTSGRIRGNHDGGSIVFGADGMLYILIGDQNQRGQLQNLTDGPGPGGEGLAGVVLRLTDEGAVPDDNPFVAAAEDLGGDAAEDLAKVWAYGIRNGFGLAVHPETGALWQTENGDDSWDEVNVLPAGANSGWIQFMGPAGRFDEYRDLETASEDGLDNPEFPPDQLAEDEAGARERLVGFDGSAVVDPVFAWRYPVAVTSVALVTDGAVGGDGAGANGDAWFGTVLTDGLFRYPLAADGGSLDVGGIDGLDDLVDDNASKGDLGESAGQVVGTGFGVVTQLLQGPDRFLYAVSLTGGAVYRIGPADRIGGGAGGGGGSSPAPSASGTTSATPLPGEETALTIGTDAGSELRFEPTTAEVPAGAAVALTFDNRSTVPHNLTFGQPIAAATNTIVAAGSSETIRFSAPTTAGEHEFVCTLHPGMTGVLTVTE